MRPSCRHFNVLLEGYRDRISHIGRKRVRSEGEETSQEDSRLLDEAWKMYGIMINSTEIRPDEYTVSIMTGLCRDSADLSHFLKQANRRLGIALDSAVLRSAIAAYGRLGDPSSACWVFTKFAETAESVRSWNVLLGALTESAGMPDKNLILDLWSSASAQSLWDLSLDEADEEAHSVMDGCTVPEAARRILEHLDTISRSHSRLRPDSQTYCLVASALQYSTTGPEMALRLFRNATRSSVPADGRFVNAVLRCFGDDIDAALSAWKSEMRPHCLKYENRKRNSPPPLQRTRRKNLVAAYHGLLYVSGRALRPEIALRLVYAMVKEGIEPNETALRCYYSGKLVRDRIFRDKETSSFFRGVHLIIPYESLLYIECTKYSVDDVRRVGERRVRIIM